MERSSPRFAGRACAPGIEPTPAPLDFGETQRFYNAGFAAGVRAALDMVEASVLALPNEDRDGYEERWVRRSGVTGIIEIARREYATPAPLDVDCGDPFHKTAECPTCGLPDTGYDRGYRDALAATPAPLDVDAPDNANDATTSANATPAPLDVLVAARAVVDAWEETVTATVISRTNWAIERLRYALAAYRRDGDIYVFEDYQR